MPYQFVTGLSQEDVGFQASGKTLEELFISASDALTNVMVHDVSSIDPKEELVIEVKEEKLDLLLCRFLEEFVYYKDARQMFLRCRSIQIEQKKDSFQLTAQVYGEKIDPHKHKLQTDVKAVTFYHLKILQSHDEWQATVVVDV